MKPTVIPHLMALLVAAYSLAAIFGGEVLSVNNGFGWDGTTYAAIAKDFPGQVFGHQLDSYRVQRIFPSGAVHYGLRLLGLSPADDAHILRGFQVLNMLLLIAGVYAWNGIAARLRLSARGTWLGFVAIYVNFAVLKMTFYSPVLTDTTALAAGMFLLYGYLAGHTWLVWIVSLVGAFSWPLILPMAFVLLAFPRSAVEPAVETGRVAARWWIAGGLAVTLTAAWRVYAVGQTIDGAEPIWYLLVPLAAMLLCAYLAAAAWWLMDHDAVARLRHVFNQSRPQAALTALSLAAAVVLLRATVFVPSGAPGYTLKQFLCAILVSSVAKPGVFLVAHVVYFGPIVLATVFLWPQVCERIRRQGLAMVLLAGAAVLLSVASESRQLLSFLPFAAAFAVQAIDDLPRQRWHDLVFLATGLVVSKCWLPLNGGPPSGNLLEFPDQLYFMNQGPWMSNVAYVVQGAIVLVLAAVFGWMYRGLLLAQEGITKTRKDESTKGQDWDGRIPRGRRVLQ